MWVATFCTSLRCILDVLCLICLFLKKGMGACWITPAGSASRILPLTLTNTTIQPATSLVLCALSHHRPLTPLPPGGSSLLAAVRAAAGGAFCGCFVCLGVAALFLPPPPSSPLCLGWRGCPRPACASRLVCAALPQPRRLLRSGSRCAAWASRPRCTLLA